MKVLYLLTILCLCIIAVVNCTDAPALPTLVPDEPTDAPSNPTDGPTDAPSTLAPTDYPTEGPTDYPTELPTERPTELPTVAPTAAPNGVWCGDVCVDGSINGPTDKHSTCKYKWKQCKVDGKIALIGVLAALGVVLLLILICVCKCFCCQGKRKSKGAKLSEFRKAEKERLLGDEEEQVSSTPITDQKRALMREKWGIKDRS